MKNILFLFCLILFSVNQVFCESIKIEEILRDEFDYSNFNGFSEYIPFSISSDGRSIVKNGKEKTENINVLFTEDYDIIECVYNANNQLLVYTYGTGSVSVPAIYNINNNNKTILMDILYDGGNEIVFRIVRNIAWKDNERILYSVYDIDTGLSHVKVYNINTKHIEYYFSGRNITLCDYNPITKQMLFDESIGKEIKFYLYDFNKKTKLNVLSSEYSDGYVLSNDRVLGIITKNSSNTGNSFITINHKDDVIFKKESLDNIIGGYEYDHYLNILVLLVEDNQNKRFITVLKILE